MMSSMLTFKNAALAFKETDVDLACKIMDHLTDFGFCVECAPYRGCVEFGVELIIKTE